MRHRLADLAARKEEENTTMSLLRGECEAFRQRVQPSGLDVYVASNVPKGSGVSSSAAFEVLIGVILNDCFMTKRSPHRDRTDRPVGGECLLWQALRSDGPDGFQRGQHHHH